MNTWNAGQILTVVRTVNKMDIDYLGSDTVTQNQMLFQFMNVALWNLVRLCYNTETSDVVTVTADGHVQFTKGNTAISNLYEPLRMLKITNGVESEVPKRYSDTAPVGWYCEGPNQPIDLRGVTGEVKLKYIRYPRQVTQESDPVEIPESGYKALIMEISSLVKSVKNFYEEANAMAANAKAGYPVIAQAAMSARGPSAVGHPPDLDDAKRAGGVM
jgi:hypothetical protein